MNILFICTHNRCRSILCEAIANHLGGGRLVAVSAGSQPAGQVHPLSLHYLAQRGIATDGLRSKSWDEFAGTPPDLAITVCDSAAGESCPLWLGACPKVHWGLSDPSKLQGDEDDIAAAFNRCMDHIERRIRALLARDFENLSGSQRQVLLQEIHQQALREEQDRGTV